MAARPRRSTSLLKLNRGIKDDATSIATGMLDTRSNPPVVHGPTGFDDRVRIRPKPSFGLGSLRSRKGLLTLITLLFAATGLLYAQYRATTYTASGQLLVYIKQIVTGADLAILPGRADLPLVQNQIELLRSGNVLTAVIEALQLDKDPEFSDPRQLASETSKVPPSGSRQAGTDSAMHNATLDIVRRKLSIRQIGTSHMVRVSFKASNPDKAARIVNKLIRVYFQELDHAAVTTLSKAPELRELYQSLGPSALLISEAEPPLRADGPPAALIVAVATLLGFGLGAAATILLDAANDTIRSAQQMEYVLGVECFGVLARRADIQIPGSCAAARLYHAPEWQSLRFLAAAVLEPSPRGPRTVGVTSTLPGEGATTLAIGLAQAAAASGKKVLLIDAVMGNPFISRWAAKSPANLPGPHGELYSWAFDGLVKLEAGLHVLPLAELSEGNVNLLRSSLLDGVLTDAADSYDLVIVDMPSLVEGPDVRAAARLLDGFLLVVKWGATDSELVRQAFQSAGEARPKFIGAILNMADEKAMKLYGCRHPADLKSVAMS